jgi:hypothetical protein
MVSTYVLNKSNPTHGGAYKQIMHMIYIYNKEQVKFYLQTHLLMQGFIFEKVFANQFYNQSDSVVLRKPLWNYRTPCPR